MDGRCHLHCVFPVYVVCICSSALDWGPMYNSFQSCFLAFREQKSLPPGRTPLALHDCYCTGKQFTSVKHHVLYINCVSRDGPWCNPPKKDTYREYKNPTGQPGSRVQAPECNRIGPTVRGELLLTCSVIRSIMPDLRNTGLQGFDGGTEPRTRITANGNGAMHPLQCCPDLLIMSTILMSLAGNAYSKDHAKLVRKR